MVDTRQDQATRGDSDEAGGQFGTVFYVSVGISVAFVVVGVLFTEPFSTALSSAVDGIVAGLGWLYLLLTTLFLAFVLVLAFSRYGKIRLGGPDAKPEFRLFPWFA
ncbi:MAG: BCCT family transporter, partial [Actinobacteria bacterium]|nr:BCCT family transporter [Actinomycetota bacterium]